MSNPDQGFSLLCHNSFAFLAYPVVIASGPEGKIRQIPKGIFSCRVSPRPSPCMGWLHPEPHGKSKLVWGTSAAGGTDSLSFPKAALCLGYSAPPLFSRHAGFASHPPYPHYVPLVIQGVLGLVCPAFPHIPKSLDHEVTVFYVQLCYKQSKCPETLGKSVTLHTTCSPSNPLQETSSLVSTC